MTTFASIFSGGCLADVGMQAAGWRHLWGIELVPAIAEVARTNGFTVHVADARCVDFKTLERPTHLHCSPPCTRASVANSDAKESPLDGELAAAVCRAIEALRPDTFTLENVYPYRKFQAYRDICACLDRFGYWWEHHHCNSADFGVPQTRKRLILRATLADHLRPLPSPVPWVGWYAAIEDLISTLPESRFADWQLARLPAELGTCMVARQQTASGSTGEVYDKLPVRGMDEPALSLTTDEVRAFLLHGTSTLELREEEEPSAAVMATVHAKAAMPKAFLVSDQSGAAGEGLQIMEPGEPATTVRANAGGGAVPRAFITSPTGYGPEERGKGYYAADEPVPTVLATNMKQRAFIVEGTAAGMDNKFALPVREQQEPLFTVRGSNPLRAFLVESKNANQQYGDGIRPADEPATTVITDSRDSHQPKAFLVDGKPANYDGDTLQIKEGASPTPPVTATQTQHPFRAWLSHGRTVSMTPRALARFQSVPDRFELPASKKLACTVLGNGIPCLMMQRIAESLG